MTNAIEELKTMIRGRYPDAQFEVKRAGDDPRSILLETTVDIDEPEDVLDLVIDRVIDLQIEERLPIHVIPLQPIERVVADLKQTNAHLRVATEKTTGAVS